MCEECGTPLGSRRKRFCTDKCRYRYRDRNRSWDHKRALTCAGCNKRIWKGPSSLPQGQARCQPCRRAYIETQPRIQGDRKYDYRRPCIDCSGPSYGERCRGCHDALIQREADPVAAARRKRENGRRYRLEKAAPGLSKWQRYKLLNLWRKQGRPCAYCLSSPAQCVDHVIPLALGGTNHEGNLTPACTDCNLRKSDSLLIEWRHKKRTRRQRVEPPPRDRPYRPRAAKPKAWADVAFKTCETCGALHATSRRRYCSEECMWDANRTLNRNRYRSKVGIPLDSPLHARSVA